MTIEWLKLGHNSLSSVPSEALQNLTALRELDLRDNNISVIPGDAFAGYGTSLKFLYLQKNRYVLSAHHTCYHCAPCHKEPHFRHPYTMFTWAPFFFFVFNKPPVIGFQSWEQKRSMCAESLNEASVMHQFCAFTNADNTYNSIRAPYLQFDDAGHRHGVSAG